MTTNHGTLEFGVPISQRTNLGAVNFLPAADHITMLGDKTTVRNQVRFDSVDPSGWGILESDSDSSTNASGYNEGTLEETPVKESAGVALDPVQKTEADLSRQTGDYDCYRIYVRSLGKMAISMLLIGSVVHTAMFKMPRELDPLDSESRQC
jgi:hypothetical protein